MNKDTKIKWIQISDLHFGSNQEYAKKSREALKKHVAEKKNEIDYIFITGDIIYAKDLSEEKREEAYKEAGEYIKEIYRLIWKDDEKYTKLCKRIFIVPGNHDLIRSAANVNNVEGMIKYYTKGNGEIDESYLDAVRNALGKYYKFYGELKTIICWIWQKESFIM